MIQKEKNLHIVNKEMQEKMIPTLTRLMALAANNNDIFFTVRTQIDQSIHNTHTRIEAESERKVKEMRCVAVYAESVFFFGSDHCKAHAHRVCLIWQYYVQYNEWCVWVSVALLSLYRLISWRPRWFHALALLQCNQNHFNCTVIWAVSVWFIVVSVDVIVFNVLLLLPPQ